MTDRPDEVASRGRSRRAPAPGADPAPLGEPLRAPLQGTTPGATPGGAPEGVEVPDTAESLLDGSLGRAPRG